jgi:hypothetical protein
VFTVVAWGSVGLVPRATEVQHVTVLDHIAMPPGGPVEEQYQRATSFFSVYLPEYGFTRVALERMGDQRDLLLPWTPPGEQPAPFPNTDTFRVDVARDMAELRLPSRATTTQLYAHWMGGVDAKWGGLLRVDPANPVRVVTSADGSEASLAGSIISELPGTLKDVTIFWIRNQRMVNRTYARENAIERDWITRSQSGSMTNVGYGTKLPAEGVDTGGRIDLAARFLADGSTSLGMQLGRSYVDPYSSRSQQIVSDAATVTLTDQRRFMEMMSIFHQIPPPQYIAERSGPSSAGNDTVTFHRDLARELDLSTWFTRPCVIVVGFLENSTLPIPLRIGSSEEAPSSTGLTMIRWVYPLPVEERIAFPHTARDESDEEAGDGT